MDIRQIDRYESFTPNGSEIVRKFWIADYEKRTEVTANLLGGCNSLLNQMPSPDIYYTNFYCYKVETTPLSADGFSGMDNIYQQPSIKKSLIEGNEKSNGGCIITAHYQPVVSIGDDGNFWNYVNYTQELEKQEIAIPKGALIDLNTATVVKASVPDDVKLSLTQTYYKISFTRVNVPWKLYQTEIATLAKLTNTINKKAFAFPGSKNTYEYPATTLRFDGTQTVDKVGFYLNIPNEQRMVDITYFFTWNSTYDVCYERDGSQILTYIGFTRTLLHPGCFLGGVGGVFEVMTYFPVGWYKYGWRKQLFPNGQDISEPYVLDVNATENGFSDIFSLFTGGRNK